MSSQQSQVWWVELELEEDDSYEPTMNEIIRDIINGKITNEEEETLCAEALAQKQAQNAVEVAAELVKDKDAELKKLEEPPDAFMCPITKEIMLDPVIDKEGNSYERAAIMEWLRNHNTSPVTRNPLSQDDLTENRALKNAIHEYYEKTGQEMPEPPAVSAEATPAAAAAAAAGAAAVAAAAAAPVQQQVFNLNTPEGQAAADAHFAQLAQLQAADEEQQEQEDEATEDETPFTLVGTLPSGSEIEQLLPFPATLTVAEIRQEIAQLVRNFRAFTVRDTQTGAIIITHPEQPAAAAAEQEQPTTAEATEQRPQIPPVEELENIQALFSELSDNGGMSDDEARDAFSNYLDGFGIDIDVYMRMLEERSRSSSHSPCSAAVSVKDEDVDRRL